MACGKMQYALFDLDNTLYTDASGLFDEVGQRIEAWTAQALRLSLEETQILRRRYFSMYGTTMAGLLHEHPEVDIDAYLDYVHAIDITRYLTPDPALAAMLAALPGTKIVFTNSIRDWAERVTVQLGIRQYFERIIDVRAVHYKSKPHPEAYAQVLDMLGVPGNACVLLDDQASYLRGAAAYGMRTVLIRTGSVVTEGFDFAVDHILDAGPILQRLLADNHGTKA